MNEKELAEIEARANAATHGPWALLMPVEDIEKFRDKFQAEVNALPQSEKMKFPCTCDPAYIGATTRRDGTVICHKCKRERGKANE